MRIGQVIGKATMNTTDAALKGGRYLVVNPLEANQLKDACKSLSAITSQNNLIVYDNLGAGQYDVIGFSEGGEATAPFSEPIPIDALCIAIFDTINYNP
jgi:carbon dioxide concentrating mechanism protein CcmL